MQNKALHHLNTSLHEKNHFLSLKEAEFEERIFAETTKNEELQNKLDDMEYELTKCKLKNGKMEASLIETQETLKLYVTKVWLFMYQFGGRIFGLWRDI